MIKIDTQRQSSSFLLNVSREIKLLKILTKEPNNIFTTKLIDVRVTEVNENHTKSTVFIIQDLVDYSLHDLLDTRKFKAVLSE